MHWEVLVKGTYENAVERRNELTSEGKYKGKVKKEIEAVIKNAKASYKAATGKDLTSIEEGNIIV